MKELEREYLSDLKDRLTEIFNHNEIQIHSGSATKGDGPADAVVTVVFPNKNLDFVVDIKSEVSNLLQVKNALEKFKEVKDTTYLLLSPSIAPSVKTHMASNGGAYYEINSELFLPIFVWMSSKKGVTNYERIIKRYGYRSDIPSKLIVLFTSSPEVYLNEPQRMLAEILDVAVGTVNKGMARLEELGVIQTRGGHGKRTLSKIEFMADRWRRDLFKLEREKLSLGRFSPINQSFYQEWRTSLQSFNSYWAGEPAAAIRTGYLTPGAFKIYTYEENPSKLLNHFRLKKDANGDIEIFKCFWPDEVNNKSEGTVPDFVTYCELLNSGIDRNVETANFLKEKLDKQLKDWIWEYGKNIY